MPRPRIPAVVFLTSFDAGGTERQMIELVRRLDRERFEVHVACFRREGEWRARAEEHAASVREFPIRSFIDPGTIRQAAAFARWCRALRATVVQACDLYSNIFALPAAAAAGVPVRIGSRRGLNPDRSLAHRFAQRVALRFADRVVANSQTVASLLERGRQVRGRLTVISNGIDLSQFRPGATTTGPIRRVGTVSSLRGVKGLDTLIEAAALARREIPDLEVTIAGGGRLRPALEDQARRAGLSGRVSFLGHREDVAEVLRGLDLFVLPSRSEAFPNAVIEAMAMALPIIATSVGGVPEMLEHGRTGILVPPGRPDALAAAIVDLARRPERARDLGRQARIEAAGRYSFERMVAQFEALYLEIAARKRVTASPSARKAAAAR